MTGFPAALMIQAEYQGIPCLIITSISDSHYVSEESMAAFKPVVREVLEMPNFDFTKLHSLPGFKGALKEANVRENSIFT